MLGQRYCSCGADLWVCGKGHCTTHHRDYPVLNSPEGGCPGCKSDTLVDNIKLAFKTSVDQSDEITRLRARVEELEGALAKAEAELTILRVEVAKFTAKDSKLVFGGEENNKSEPNSKWHPNADISA